MFRPWVSGETRLTTTGLEKKVILHIPRPKIWDNQFLKMFETIVNDLKNMVILLILVYF